VISSRETQAGSDSSDEDDLSSINDLSSIAIIRKLAVADRGEFVTLVESSAEFLHPWVYLPDNFDKFDSYLRRFDGTSAQCIVVCARDSGKIVGAVSISEIIQGPYKRATVGYNAFKESVRQGYMSAGFELVFKYAFEKLGLHRLEADIQPGNAPSLRFAKKIGFRREGYSPGFVCIKGIWKDHERWAINSDMIKL
jgi:[ribosomal protein S5]-alanine N-acetyltransferase